MPRASTISSAPAPNATVSGATWKVCSYPPNATRTLTALANTEPVVGAQRKEAQSLQWFLSESRWDPEKVNERRLEVLLGESTTAPEEKGVLIIDEHGERKWGKRTAHVGRQWLANIGKTENGVVSVSSLWAQEGMYYPVDFEPYTPSHHFEGGKDDPLFRTKLKIAEELVELAVEKSIPFRAVVADSFYTAKTGSSSVLLGSWESATCWRSRSRTRGGIWRRPLVPCGKRQRPPDGRRLRSRGIGRRWCDVFAADIHRSGERRRLRPVPTVRSEHKERWWSLLSPKDYRILLPGI